VLQAILWYNELSKINQIIEILRMKEKEKCLLEFVLVVVAELHE
jgi:hypothetical protein